MTDPIKSLELLVQNKNGSIPYKMWATEALNFFSTDAPRLLAIIRRQREALENIATWSQESQDCIHNKETAVMLWRGCIAVARAALNDEGETNV